MEEKKVQAIKLLIIRATIVISFLIISLCAIELVKLVPMDNVIIGILVIICELIFCSIGCIEAYKLVIDMMYFNMSANLEEENKLSVFLKKYISKKLRNIIDN